MFKRLCILGFLLMHALLIKCQVLEPGFNPDEYLELLRISAKQVDSVFKGVKIPAPSLFHLEYRSPEYALKNRWDLWVNDNNSIMVVSLRGTVADASSWLENFYAAMIPATGTLQLNDSTTFDYKFSDDPKSAVHVGWTIGIACIAPGITEKIKEYYGRGIRQLIIAGHSQGGALAFLLRSYLYYQAKENKLQDSLIIKTYCSAAPKPGNLYYAYDFDYITRNGWAFTVVNSEDWVPETPISIQTINDFNEVNPLTNAKKQLGKQPFFVRLYLGHVYNRLQKTTNKSQKTFTKYLGSSIYKQVKKYMPQLKEPHYISSDNYVRAGNPVVLKADEAYKKLFPDNKDKIFMHHVFEPYYFLTKEIYKPETVK